MGGFFLRPKDTNLDKTNNHINAEAIGVVSDYDAEYTDQTGIAVHKRRHPSNAAEPAPSFAPAVRAGKGNSGRGK